MRAKDIKIDGIYCWLKSGNTNLRVRVLATKQPRGRLTDGVRVEVLGVDDQVRYLDTARSQEITMPWAERVSTQAQEKVRQAQLMEEWRAKVADYGVTFYADYLASVEVLNRRLASQGVAEIDVRDVGAMGYARSSIYSWTPMQYDVPRVKLTHDQVIALTLTF